MVSERSMEMTFPKAYIDFLIHFHADRDYFQCHEVLETYWKETCHDKLDSMWIGFIQIAVSFYHYRRKNFVGAKKLMIKAIQLLEKNQAEIERLQLEPTELLTQMQHTLTNINENKPYKSIHLPFKNKAFLQVCKRKCAQRGLVWGRESDVSNHYLLNYHTLRDRTSIRKSREIAKQRKHQKRSGLHCSLS